MKTQIDSKRLRELERAEAKLNALEVGGVDNWDFYDESLKEYRANEELEGKLEDLISDLFSEIGGDIDEPAGRGAGYGLSEAGYEKALQYLLKAGVTFKEDAQ